MGIFQGKLLVYRRVANDFLAGIFCKRDFDRYLLHELLVEPLKMDHVPEFTGKK